MLTAICWNNNLYRLLVDRLLFEKCKSKKLLVQFHWHVLIYMREQIQGAFVPWRFSELVANK